MRLRLGDIFENLGYKTRSTRGGIQGRAEREHREIGRHLVQQYFDLFDTAQEVGVVLTREYGPQLGIVGILHHTSKQVSKRTSE